MLHEQYHSRVVVLYHQLIHCFQKCGLVLSRWYETNPPSSMILLGMVFNIPGLAGAVLQTPLALIHSLSDPFPPNIQNCKS